MIERENTTQTASRFKSTPRISVAKTKTVVNRGLHYGL